MMSANALPVACSRKETSLSSVGFTTLESLTLPMTKPEERSLTVTSANALPVASATMVLRSSLAPDMTVPSLMPSTEKWLRESMVTSS